MKLGWLAPLLALVLAACTVPSQYGGGIPIDHEGLAARLRRACELGKATAAGGACESAEVEEADADSEDSRPDGEPGDAEVESDDGGLPDSEASAPQLSFARGTRAPSWPAMPTVGRAAATKSPQAAIAIT